LSFFLVTVTIKLLNISRVADHKLCILPRKWSHWWPHVH